MKKLIGLFLALTVCLTLMPVKSEAHPLCQLAAFPPNAKYGFLQGDFWMNGGIGVVMFAPLIAACTWHIPAWTRAKAQGGDAEAIYQAQEMWPQQVFDKLPGSHTRTWIGFKLGNGGNFKQGIDSNN